MLDGIDGSFSSSARSKFAIVACASDRGHVDLGAAAPDHDEPIEPVVLLEQADVFHHLLGQVALVLALLDVRAVEPLDVALIEDRRPGPDLLELRANLLEQRRLEDAGRLRRRVAVVVEDVPAAEDEIVERRQRHDVADLGRPAFGPFAEADGAHLRQRADGFRQTFANSEHAGDGRRADGAEADEQDAELAACRSDLNGCRHKGELYQPPDRTVNCS